MDNMVMEPVTVGPRALDHLWMGNVPLDAIQAAGGPLVLTRGKGVYLWDEHGRRYLDAIASLEAVAIGHGRTEIKDAVVRQYEQLEFLDTLRFTSKPAVELADRIASLTPGDLDAVHFASSGSEAVETALKIARQYHVVRGKPEKFKVIARAGAYHGCTYGAMALDGNYYRTHREFFEPLPPISRFVQSMDRADEFEDVIRFERPHTVAAIVVDPIATASGIYPPPDGYWARLREICDRYDVILIADEVITGFGRTGQWFASDRDGIVPDLITVSKSLSSGYFPISAAVASRRVAVEFRGDGVRAFSHGHTFGGHPVACAAALENLRIIEEEGLVEAAGRAGALLSDSLRNLLPHPLVHSVRGTGLLYGIELVDQSVPDEPPLVLGQQVVTALRENGVLTFVLHPGNVLFLCPPLIITADQIQELITAISVALDSVQARRHQGPGSS